MITLKALENARALQIADTLKHIHRLDLKKCVC